MRTLRLEANSGVVICLGILSATFGIITISCNKEKTKRDIEFKKIESELRARHADMVAGCDK